MDNATRIEQLDKRQDDFQQQVVRRLDKIELAQDYTNKTLDKIVITTESTNAKALKNETDIWQIKQVLNDPNTGLIIRVKRNEDRIQESRDWRTRITAMMALIGALVGFFADSIRQRIGL